MMKLLVFLLLVAIAGVHVEGHSPCVVRTDSVNNCRYVCLYMKNCRAFTWNSASKYCYPKGATGWRAKYQSVGHSGLKYSYKFQEKVDFYGGDLRWPPC